MSETFCGMALKIENYLFMLVNSAMSVGRQNFTIGHELYHLFIQENFTSQICVVETFSKKDKEEYNADLFSSHLLLPRAGVLKLIPESQLSKDKVQLDTVLNIEHHFSCSRIALLYRLSEMGLISEDKFQEYSANVYEKAKELNYPTHLYFPTKEVKFIGNDYISNVKTLFQSDKIKEIEYLTLLKDVGISEI
jgi:Zn-dependent peptidase ImmA (M78 family)